MRLYAGTYQGVVYILEGTPTALALRTAKPISENSIRAIALAQDMLVVGGYDQELRGLHPENGVELRESKESLGAINCVRQVSEGVTAVGLESGQIRFWDVRNWACKKGVREHHHAVADLQVDAKGLLLVSAAGREVNFWSVETLKPLYHYKFDFDVAHLLLVHSFDFLFLLGDRTIRKVSTAENKELARLDLNEKIQCGAVFLDFLLVATEKGEVRIWKHDSLVHCIHFQAHNGRLKAMKIVSMEDSDFLVTAEANGEISVWDILEFLKGVEAISQDYPLVGLKPLSTVSIKQRIICLEAVALQPQEDQPEQEQEEEAQKQPVKPKKQKKGKAEEQAVQEKKKKQKKIHKEERRQ